MQQVLAVALCILYFAGVIAGVPMVEPYNSWLFLAAWSAVFVWCYLSLLRGRPFIAVSIVIVVTIVFPIVALIAIAWPIYRAWPPLFASLWPALQDRALGGLELLAPLVAALICVPLARRFSFNVAGH
jgi:hypothetical protein